MGEYCASDPKNEFKNGLLRQPSIVHRCFLSNRAMLCPCSSRLVRKTFHQKLVSSQVECFQAPHGEVHHCFSSSSRLACPPLSHQSPQKRHKQTLPEPYLPYPFDLLLQITEVTFEGFAEPLRVVHANLSPTEQVQLQIPVPALDVPVEPPAGDVGGVRDVKVPTPNGIREEDGRKVLARQA